MERLEARAERGESILDGASALYIHTDFLQSWFVLILGRLGDDGAIPGTSLPFFYCCGIKRWRSGEFLHLLHLGVYWGFIIALIHYISYLTSTGHVAGVLLFSTVIIRSKVFYIIILTMTACTGLQCA